MEMPPAPKPVDAAENKKAGLWERLKGAREEYRELMRTNLDKVLPGLFDGMDQAGIKLFEGAVLAAAASAIGLPEIGLLVGGRAVYKAQETLRENIAARAHESSESSEQSAEEPEEPQTFLRAA